MTSEQPTSAAAIAKLEELGRQRRAAGKKAGTLKQESLDVWTELFVAAVTEDHGALGTVIAIPGLPPRVAAAGLAKLWPQLDQAARVRVLRLLPKDSDKGSPMRFSLASELMDIDPTTAAEQLADLPRSNESCEQARAVVKRGQPEARRGARSCLPDAAERRVTATATCFASPGAGIRDTPAGTT